jgi:two-component sensor histidine kinase
MALPCMQVQKREQALQSSQAELEECQTRLRALEAAHQQHLAGCSAEKAASAEREAALEEQCSRAKHDASIAR